MKKQYLGLDLGTKTVGIAYSSSGIIASALHTFRFEEHRYELAVKHIQSLIEEYRITDVIIGLPKHMNNDEGERAKHSEWFKNELKHVDITLWDERLSTKSAMQAMRAMGASNKQKKEHKDTLAAVVILQNYLDSKESL